MKVLVTGGAGFIGSHIVDKLIRDKNEVVIIDNLSTGEKTNLNVNAKFYQIDITSPELENIFNIEKPEIVIHQAAQVDVTRSIKDPIFDAQVNILGALNILENCRKHKVRKIVYGNSGGAGSGEPQYLPIDENHPIKPLCPYGISKHTIEHYLHLYAQLYKLKYTSLRYANVYGPRQDPFGEGGVIAIFCYKIINNETPLIYGDGNQTRDFVYVEDVAKANIMAIENGDNDCFNVSASQEISINNLFNTIKNICKSEISVKHTNARKGEIVRSVLNNNKIKNKIGWKPQINLNDGLKKTIFYFKNNGKNLMLKKSYSPKHPYDKKNHQNQRV